MRATLLASSLARLRCYRFDWKLSLLTVLLLPLLVNLGMWQLRREAEKLVLQAQYNDRQQEAPQALASINWAEDLQYRQVSFAGYVDAEHVFLLDNRTFKGQAGYEVVVPIVMDNGTVVLVNRGWLAPGATRAQLPVIPSILSINGQVSLTGSVYQSVGETLVLGDSLESEGWPKVVQTLAPQRLAILAGYADATKVFPYVVRLAEGAPGVLIRFWPVISTSPEKHRGYAVQWFLMASALVLLYLYYSTRRESPVNATTEKQEGKQL
jgi:surfeit locus 1 family protein